MVHVHRTIHRTSHLGDGDLLAGSRPDCRVLLGESVQGTAALIEVLYRDDDYLAVRKPPGLSVHRGRLNADRDVLLQRLRRQVGCYLYPIHRLDRATSGVIVFGLNAWAAGAVQAQMRSGDVAKHYAAIVRGWVLRETEIDYEIDGQYAYSSCRPHTRYELDEPDGRFPSSRYSLLDVTPKSGRRHQIRRHLAHLRHPIVGDTVHGDGKHNRIFRERFGSWRLLLFARSIAFMHLRQQRQLRIECGFDADWTALLRELDAYALSSS